MERLETALMTAVKHTILERFNATSLSLQKVDIDLISAVKLYGSLVTFLLQLRDRFGEKEEKTKYIQLFTTSGCVPFHVETGKCHSST